MHYRMKFMRSVDVKTNTATGEEKGHNCPNCGAPLEISSSGKCEYCGSVVTTGQYSWVLSDFGVFDQNTPDEGISGADLYDNNGGNNNNGGGMGYVGGGTSGGDSSGETGNTDDKPNDN